MLIVFYAFTFPVTNFNKCQITVYSKCLSRQGFSWFFSGQFPSTRINNPGVFHHYAGGILRNQVECLITLLKAVISYQLSVISYQLLVSSDRIENKMSDDFS